jgi:hypothetical protein
MAKTSNPTEISDFRTGSSTGVSVFLDARFAARFVEAIIFELRRALAAEAEYQGLVRRSAQQLARMGLKHADLPDHLRRRHYS